MRELQSFDNRAKSVIKLDKNKIPKNIIPLLSSDIFKVASDFMVLDYDDVKCDLIDENELLVFNIQITPKRVKEYGILPSDN